LTETQGSTVIETTKREDASFKAQEHKAQALQNVPKQYEVDFRIGQLSVGHGSPQKKLHRFCKTTSIVRSDRLQHFDGQIK
jgi:hypothetical protein